MEEHKAEGDSRPDRPLRLVMVIQRFRPYFSGQGVQVEELSKELARRGVDVTVVTAIRGRDAPLEEGLDGARVRRLRCDLLQSGDSRLSRRLWSPTFAFRTAVFLWRRRREIDLVHVHGVNDALYGAWLVGRLRGLPVLFEMTLMGADDPRAVQRTANLFAGLRYAIYRRFEGYVAISPSLADAYRQAGLPAERLRTIPQGVDLGKFRPAADRAELRRELGLPETGPLCVFLGSLVARKGIDVLLRGWGRIHGAAPTARLALVGRDRFADDPEAEELLRRELAALGPGAARVLRFGTRDDAWRFLQAADAFLFPSRREGFGTAIVEAMACGLPCVTAELPGITDFIFAAPARAPGGAAEAVPDGLVVPQEDPEALAEAALALLSDRGRAARIGAAARARAAHCFDIRRVVDRYLDYYADLLARRTSRTAPT